MADSPGIDPGLEQHIAEVHRRVGRNVIRVQRLESALKALVPYLDIQGAANCLDGLDARAARTANQTLGQLIKSFRNSFSSESPEIRRDLESILADRNDLVHQFHKTYGSLWRGIDGRVATIAKLDAQFEMVSRFEQVVLDLLVQIFRIFRDCQDSNSDAFRAFEEIHRQVESELRTHMSNDV
jgi:hypothetical protein